jgi:hypothetical protein
VYQEHTSDHPSLLGHGAHLREGHHRRAPLPVYREDDLRRAPSHPTCSLRGCSSTPAPVVEG